MDITFKLIKINPKITKIIKMFSKKCPNCRNKVKKEFEYCPFCRINLKSIHDKQDYGLLGKNDLIKDPFPSFGNSLMENLFNKAIKMMEKQMSDIPKNQKPGLPNNLHVQLFVNGKRIPINNQNTPKQKRKPVLFVNEVSDDKKEKLASLPREEPPSRVRRMAGKVIYELEVPGVENIEDVLINQLENSIEVKAISSNKIYSKIFNNVKNPIIGYKLDEGNLVLELQG